MIKGAALLVLAAGASSRFGSEKLMAPIDGRPMVSHVLDLAQAFAFTQKIAILRSDLHEVVRLANDAGFEIVFNAEPHLGLARSLALGVGAIADARAALVLLADMPFVTPDHIRALFDHYDEACGAIASSRCGVRTPPTILGRPLFGRIAGLEGDRGARAFIADAPVVEGAPDMLRDIDAPGDM